MKQYYESKILILYIYIYIYIYTYVCVCECRHKERKKERETHTHTHTRKTGIENQIYLLDIKPLRKKKLKKGGGMR